MADIVYLEEGADLSFLAGSSCAFGVFDGVHRGHRFLIKQAQATAAMSSGRSVALTFSIDPDELFAADRLVKLMSNEERLCALAETGVDFVAVLPFDREFASLSPQAFLERVFGDNAPAHIHVGEGFRFGTKGSGDVAVLGAWGEPRGMQVHCHDLLRVGDEPVSSTRIRRLLRDGKILEAESLLEGPEQPIPPRPQQRRFLQFDYRLASIYITDPSLRLRHGEIGETGIVRAIPIFP